VSVWLKRFGLHMAAAIGATSIFVAAAAVGANQTRQPAPQQQPALAAPSAQARATPRPNQPRRTPTPTTPPSSAATPTPDKVAPERSLAGTVSSVLPDGLDVLGVGGREWRVSPTPAALIRLNGKAARLDALHVGDTVVILGQAQPRDGPLYRFLAHAITARRK